MKFPLAFFAAFAISGVAGAATPAPLKPIENALRCAPAPGLDAAMANYGIRPPTATDHFDPAPNGLTVFGLPVAGISLAPDGDEGYYRTRFAPGVTADQVNKAASLPAGKSRNVKLPHGKQGTLDIRVINGAVILDCTVN